MIQLTFAFELSGEEDEKGEKTKRVSDYNGMKRARERLSSASGAAVSAVAVAAISRVDLPIDSSRMIDNTAGSRVKQARRFSWLLQVQRARTICGRAQLTKSLTEPLLALSLPFSCARHIAQEANFGSALWLHAQSLVFFWLLPVSQVASKTWHGALKFLLLFLSHKRELP